MEEKQSIILKHIRDGKSQRQIQRETGIARETIRKYTRIYETKLKELGVAEDEFSKVDLIADLVTAPKYKSSPRTKSTMTDEIIERLKSFLKENEQKRYSGLSKQQMKKTDMYEALLEEGFKVSYSSVLKTVNKIERRKKEAFIKQEYVPGDIVEFDFGTVKLYTEDGLLREYQLAIFTSAYSNYRWARLFPKQDTACFLEAHAKFFEHIKGVFRTVVYDNTRVAVKKFIGHTEKEATEALLKLSLYYKFDFRFCNAYRGNEKGHVERSVDFIRRKAFSKHLHFDSLIDANVHLENILESINSLSKGEKKKSSLELLEEEREYFLPEMPMYETARIQNFRVSKYSTIMIDSCYYSVPDSFVGVMVRCKIYSTKIIVSYDEERIAEHVKQTGINKWKIDIQHYVNTLFKKPKSLVNSTAFKQLDYKLKEIYNNYFKGDDREFLSLISLVGTYGLSSVEKAISHIQSICPNNISIDKIEFICTTKEDDKVIYLTDYESDIVQNSINMLNEFNNLLDT